MSWGSRHQLLYSLIVLIFLGIVIGLPVYFTFFNKQPTCYDRVRNQDETGVDCGGICTRACVDDVVPQPLVRWVRSFKVAGGIYNLVAYVQNPNVTYVGEPANYLFKVYDKNNIVIDVVENSVAIPPTNNFPIFEQGFDAGERIPDHVTFDFTSKVVWHKYMGESAEFSVVDENLANASTSPRLDATVVNKTFKTYKNIEVVAIIYGNDGNAIASSRTFIDLLADGQSKRVTFTWPSAFSEPYASIEVIPKVPFQQ